MSLGYLITTQLDIIYNKENIQKTIEVGTKNLYFKYYQIDYSSMNCTGKLLSINETVNYIYLSKFDPTMNIVLVEVEKSYFFLSFSQDYVHLTISFFNFFLPWSKKFIDDDTPDIDIARYIKLMLDLTSQYKILNLKVEKD